MRRQIRLETVFIHDYPVGRAIWASAWRAAIVLWFCWLMWQFLKA